MIYIFEDNKNDILSQFYQSYYSPSRVAKFIYANGANNIDKEIRRVVSTILCESREIVTVFIDVVPDNKITISHYNRLHKLFKEIGYYNYYIIPLVCAEYYMVKSLLKVMTPNNKTNVNMCMDLDTNYKSVCSNYPQKLWNNFEKFCKLILNTEFSACTITDSRNNRGGNREYYVGDCSSSCNQDNSCSLKINCSPSLKEKIEEYVSIFPLRPTVDNEPSLTHEEITKRIEGLVNKLNSNIDKFNTGLHLIGEGGFKC